MLRRTPSAYDSLLFIDGQSMWHRAEFRQLARTGIRVLCVLFLLVLGLTATTQPAAPHRPVVTDGLIHSWPNLWDAHDEVTGRDGVVMGILPAVTEGAPEETWFSDQTGWVQMPVSIPADGAFTVSVWMRGEAPIRSGGVVIGLHAGEDRWWLQHQSSGVDDAYALEARGTLAASTSDTVLPGNVWQHVAITKSASGEVAVWQDGVTRLTGQFQFQQGATLDWITAGNDIKGDLQWFGQLRDLCLFDRVLSEDEMRALHLAGRSTAPARLSPPRQAARRRADLPAWSTNLIHRSSEELTSRRYTAEDGLPANNVQSVLQTRDGYLWIGTESGLARFDGRSFRTFTDQNTPALAEVGVDVRSLAEDSDGTLWAGVYGGLLRIRGTEVTGFTNGLAESYVLHAIPAEPGALWLAGFRLDRQDRGPCRVRKFHPTTGHTSVQVVVPGHVRRLVPTPEGLWLATEDPEQLLFWNFVSPTPTVVAKISGPPLDLALRQTAPIRAELRVRGWQDPLAPARITIEMVVGDEGPVFHWLSPTRRAAASASRWTLDSNSDGWLGAQAGLLHMDTDRLEQIDFRNRPTPIEVACLAPNREGGIWLGTDADGLHFVQERLVQVFTTRDGLTGNDVRSVIATDDGRVLVGSSAGLDKLEHGQWSRVLRSSEAPLDSVVSLAQDIYGTVWLGLNYEGIDALLYLDSQGMARPAPVRPLEWMHPTTLTATPQGRVWVGCNRGLTWIDPRGASPNSPAVPADSSKGLAYGRLETGKQLPDVKFLKLAPAPDGSLWVGTVGRGLFQIDGDQAKNYTTADGLPSNICTPTRFDSTGALWVVAKGALVRRQNQTFQILTSRQGVPDDYLLDLIPDDHGHLWAPGLRGIHRFEQAQLDACLEGRIDRIQSLTLGMRDGLLTPDCTSMHYPITAKTSDGRIWVATHNGVASFDPSRIAVDSQPLAVSIEQFIVNRKPIVDPIVSPAGRPLALRPGSGERLEFHYTATSLVAADRVRFRHRLEGYDADWSPESDLRLAFYTNLRPRKYQFHVKASNAYGSWNDVPTTLPFVIAPHFWQTRFFQWTTGLLVLTLAILLHRQRLGVLRHLHELRNQQQLATERTRIAADMHDDLGAALTQIAILSEVAKSESPQLQTRSALDRISQSVRDVTARMSDLVWVTNPRNDTLENLAAYLREQVARQLENIPVRSILDFPERLPECHVSATFRRNILLVVKETLNNSLKHAAPTEILVQLVIEPGQLLLRIEDNGRGFDPVTRSAAGNGLANLRRRIQDLGGTLEIESAPGAGTKVHFRVPLPSPEPPHSLLQSTP